MTKVAIWCRHFGDNIIGIGKDIPWNVPSDLRKFNKIVEGQNIVVGRATYEILPESFNDATVFVLTSDSKYIVRNKSNHQIVNDIRDFKDFEEDLYICGGAKAYQAFIDGGSKLLPDIIVDCVYHGEITPLKGEPVDITPCVEQISKKYFKMTEDFEQDNVTTTLYIKRGDFVDQAVLKSILAIVEKDN